MNFPKRSYYVVCIAIYLSAGSTALAEEGEEDLFAGDSSDTSSSDGSSLQEEGEDASADEESGGSSELAGIGGPLMLSQNTMQFGGTIGVSIDAMITDASTDVGGSVFFAPRAGWFVIDNLELLAELGTAIPFGDDAPAAAGGQALTPYRHEFFFLVGAQYVFDFKILGLYAGGLFGMDIDANAQVTTATGGIREETHPSIIISVPVGVLIPFNPHVALDVGVRADFYIAVGDNPCTYINIPIGYLGMQGFFNFIG